MTTTANPLQLDADNIRVTASTPFLERALPLLDRGFSVIPLKPVGKEPVPGLGAKSRSQDRERIEKWAEQYPDANVGVVADENFLILDADDHARLLELLKSSRGITTPATYTVQSSPGRAHYYFRQTPKTRAAKNTAVGALFELRLKEQYVVGAGSVHPKTGLPYEVVNDCEPVPFPDALLDALLYLKGDARVKTERAKARITIGKKLGEGDGRHYAILDFCARNCTPGKSLEQQFDEAMEFNEAHCDPPRDATHVAGIVNWFEDKEPYNPGVKVVFGPTKPVSRDPKPHYLIPRKDDSRNYGHWFPRGTVSLAAGASGMGKTVLLAQMMENLRLGQPVLMHPAVTADYRFVLVDRTKKELRESIEEKGLDVEAVLNRSIEIDFLDTSVPHAQHIDSALKGWESEGSVPDAVILEGADLWCEESTDMHGTGRFLKSLIAVATAWDVAIIASVGSPKQKPKEEYALTRSKVFGSTAWGRICSTILHIALTNPEDSDSARKVQVLPRTGRCEKFWFEFKDGLLTVSYDEPAKADQPKSVPLVGTVETQTTMDRLKRSERFALVLEAIQKMEPDTVISVSEKLDPFPRVSLDGGALLVYHGPAQAIHD